MWEFWIVNTVDLFSFCFHGVFFLSRSKNFHSYGDITIAGEGLQILTYARFYEGSLTCHTFCDMGLIVVISEDPGHSHCCRAFGSGAVTTCFIRLRSVATGYRTPICRMRGERSTSTPPGWFKYI